MNFKNKAFENSVGKTENCGKHRYGKPYMFAFLLNNLHISKQYFGHSIIVGSHNCFQPYEDKYIYDVFTDD